MRLIPLQIRAADCIIEGDYHPEENMYSKIRRALRQTFILLCAIILLCGTLYTVSWYAQRSQIHEKNESYSSLYLPTPQITPEPTPEATAAPQATPTATAEPILSLPAVVDQPIPTPGADTIIISLPTAPPVQNSFSDLLALNPETIGFLKIDGLISLPVVQRENDNEFYLTHSFDLAEAAEGTLFLDGMNRLVPEDECLIVYGHNMNNGTMFGELDRYDSLSFLKAHPLVQFDTLYENNAYVPFAVFPASMTPDDDSYFDVRQIAFTDGTFDLFVSQLKSRSVVNIPVDVQRGDPILLMVTCDYTKNDGRFIVALRCLRTGETAEEAAAAVSNSR